MNKQRLAQIACITNKLTACKEQLENILTDEEFTFDNMPENLQYSSQGERSQEAQEYLNDGIDALGEVIGQLEGIM